jgi:hypothetical protein
MPSCRAYRKSTCTADAQSAFVAQSPKSRVYVGKRAGWNGRESILGNSLGDHSGDFPSGVSGSFHSLGILEIKPRPYRCLTQHCICCLGHSRTGHRRLTRTEHRIRLVNGAPPRSDVNTNIWAPARAEAAAGLAARRLQSDGCWARDLDRREIHGGRLTADPHDG